MPQPQPSSTTQPLAPALGATLHGLRLAALDDNGLAAIRQALREHLVVAFPGQHLTVEQLGRLRPPARQRRLGRLRARQPQLQA